MNDWIAYAREVVAKAAADIPVDAPIKDRRRIIAAAYPFGPRAHYPYKAWLKAVREHLDAYRPRPSVADQLSAYQSPLERLKRRALKETK